MRQIDAGGAGAARHGATQRHSGSRETHVAGTSRQARVAALFSSAPPTVRSSEVARSRRSLPGGVSRTIASPNVTTLPASPVTPFPPPPQFDRIAVTS